MDRISLSNFRCFGTEQTARLAPITLLIGENSTGKTSLMAMVRALWDVVYANRVPNFKEAPFDLGSFDEIVHNAGGSQERAGSFEASLSVDARTNEGIKEPFMASVVFGEEAAVPVPVTRCISRGPCSVSQSFDEDSIQSFVVDTRRGTWRIQEKFDEDDHLHPDRTEDEIRPIDHAYWFLRNYMEREHSYVTVRRIKNSPRPAKSDVRQVHNLVHGPDSFYFTRRDRAYRSMRPYAGAPTRSRPRRTYDPTPVKPDVEGGTVPTHLASLAFHAPSAWEDLKVKLETFGRSSGLFDEIKVRQLGDTASDPFQVHVRKSGDGHEDKFRNLAEMGYGVSQVLPVITELLRDGGARTMLLQQPEVHLHPSAAAALGTLLCEVAADRESTRRLLVETHSDFIIDRVRIAVRDGVAGLGPDDVSILYFERSGPEVQIHTLSVDDDGNLLDSPPGYRQFFLDETARFLGV